MPASVVSRVVVRVGGFALLFWAAGLVGRLTIMDATSVSLVWPAAGVAAAWLAVASAGRWWGVDVAAMAAVTVVVNVLTGASMPLALTFVMSNLAQALTFVGVFGWLGG